jgi:hypothetical protein
MRMTARCANVCAAFANEAAVRFARVTNGIGAPLFGVAA